MLSELYQNKTKILVILIPAASNGVFRIYPFGTDFVGHSRSKLRGNGLLKLYLNIPIFCVTVAKLLIFRPCCQWLIFFIRCQMALWVHPPYIPLLSIFKWG
jgi:hypothetical protein